MPPVDFDSLPDAGRVWVFASDRQLKDGEAEQLLQEVDRFLDGWKAHGAPLRSARAWRDERFLAVGIDPTAEQASGCSIDGLFRELQRIQTALQTNIVGGGRVFYRDAMGRTRMAPRGEVQRLVATGEVGDDTPVFDTMVSDVRGWRSRFERPARETWVGSLLSETQANQASSRSATKSSSARNG